MRHQGSAYGDVPDSVVDAYLFAMGHRTRPTPELRLAAVFGEALIDLQRGPVGEMERVYSDARRWVESDEHGPFAFVSLCELLDLDVEATRASMLGIAPGAPVFGGLRTTKGVTARPTIQRRASRRESWRNGQLGSRGM